LSAKEVARKLSLSHRTVEQHRNSILQKFQLRSVKQLLAEVATLGAVSQARVGQTAE
jgi:DNA-binding CsgD family transcriptional regulator